MSASPTMAEKSEPQRKSAIAAYDRKLKAVIGDPAFYGRITLTAVIQHGQPNFTIETCETMKT